MVSESIRSRLADSVETATELSGGLVIVDGVDGEEMMFSQKDVYKRQGQEGGQLYLL